jgi:imidazolonepropionase-like amidohydrolase
VIDTTSGTARRGTTVVIVGDRIVDVGVGVAPEGARIVDGGGRYLMPGLWDMHVHLSYARESALPALVANGVTGVRDMGSDLAEVDRWRAEIASGLRTGPTIVRAGPMLNGREFNVYQLAVADAAEAGTAVRALQKVGVDLIKLHRRTSREAYFAIAEAARGAGLPFAGHIPMTVSPAEASDAGQTSIEHTETLFEGTFASEHAREDLAHAIAEWRASEADALFAGFVRNDTMVTPTLIAQGYLLGLLAAEEPDPRARYIARSARERADEALAEIRPQADAFLRERGPAFRELRAVVGMMSAAGVKLLTGSDLSYFHPPGFSLHDELALLVQSGVPVADVLRAATASPAEWLDSQDFGTVGPGQRADLVLLDADPLDDIENVRRIHAVVLRGRYLDRQDLDRLLQEAAQLSDSS